MAAQLKCRIHGGRDPVDFVKTVEIGGNKGGHLSVLSKELVNFQEVINHTLSELVDKEKAMGVASGRGHQGKQGLYTIPYVTTCTVLQILRALTVISIILTTRGKEHKTM